MSQFRSEYLDKDAAGCAGSNEEYLCFYQAAEAGTHSWFCIQVFKLV